MSLDKAVAVIRKYKRFLVTTHTNLEGDALGSQLALYHLLRTMGKTVVLVNDDGIPYGYGFMPYTGRIRRFSKGMRAPRFDCFCIVDCSDLHRAGEVHLLNADEKPVLNIDHHISNGFFGTVNFVDPDASCCCELIWRLYKAFKVKLDRTAAVLLYAGILTDTGSFRYTNTTAQTHAIVAELLRYGVNPSEIYRSIYATIPYADLKLLTRVLPTMQTLYNGRLVYFEIPRKLLIPHEKIQFDLSENVLSFGRSLEGVQAVVLFKENLAKDAEVRVNFRSHGAIDVNRIAQSLGGGGHRTAAGATVRGNLASVKRKVLAAMKKVFS